MKWSYRSRTSPASPKPYLVFGVNEIGEAKGGQFSELRERDLFVGQLDGVLEHGEHVHQGREIGVR